MHNLVRAYAHHPVAEGDDVAVFTSSWKDRPAADLASELGARVVDRRVPVRVLNYAWHRLEWPPIEMLGRTKQRLRIAVTVDQRLDGRPENLSYVALVAAGCDVRSSSMRKRSVSSARRWIEAFKLSMS